MTVHRFFVRLLLKRRELLNLFFRRTQRAFVSVGVLFILGAIFLPSFYQQTGPISVYDKIDTYVEQSLSANRIPGLQLGIVQYGKVMHLQAYGEAERGRDMSVNTPMFIAELTQPFTALAVMQLVEAGKIDLDAPAQTYLPDFQVAGAQGKQITVRQLLNQTSGLSDLTYSVNLPDTASIEDRVRSLATARLTAAPGQHFRYFAPNYTVLGRIIETASGLTYSEYLRKNVLTPLDMNHTYTSLPPAQSSGLAQGYTAILGYPVARRQPFRAYDLPANYMLSTADDLTHFMIAQLSAGRYNKTQLVSPESLTVMHTPDSTVVSPYGMGWYIQDSPYGQMISINGDLDNFHAAITLYPAHRSGFVVLINQNHLLYNWVEYNAIRAGIADIFFQQNPPLAISMSFFYQIIAVLIILDIVLEMRSYMRLQGSVSRLESMSRARRNLLLWINFAVPLFILFLMPPIIQGILVQRFNWRYLFGRLPVLVFWLFFAMVMVLGRGIVRIWLLRNREKKDRDNQT